jgi:lipopolysaccharide export system permease protein
MRTLDRYLLKAFLTNYVLQLFVLISLYVVLDLFVNFDEFTEGGKQVVTVLRNIADYYGYNIPLYFSQLSGVITLVAACMTMVRLQRQNEIVAVLASGTSLYRLAAPILVGGLVMNVLLVIDQEWILPSVAPKLVRERDDVEGQRVYEVWCVRDGETRLVSALKFSPGERRARGLIIMELEEGPENAGHLRSVVTADQARWDPERHGWVLTRGVRIGTTGTDADDLAAEHRVSHDPVTFYETELTPEELRLRQTAQWVQFLSVRQLKQLETRGDVSPAKIAQIKHARLTLPIHNMILLMLGLSFFMTRLPKSVLTQAAQSLVVTAVCFLVAFAAQQVAGAAGMPPAIPAWLPIFLFGPVAVLLLESVKT